MSAALLEKIILLGMIALAIGTAAAVLTGNILYIG